MSIEKIIIDKLKRFNPKKIILFGSYVNGNFNENSDIDICIVKETKNKLQEKKEIRKALKNINLPKDIILVDEEFLKTHSTKEWINSLWYNISKYGKIIYEK